MNKIKARSVRVMQGDVYDLEWNLLFVPLNRAELDNFLTRVHDFEEEKQMFMTKEELDTLVSEFSS